MRITPFKILTILLLCVNSVIVSSGHTSPDNNSPGALINENVNVDITHQELHLSVDPAIRYISGTLKTSFSAMDSPVHSIQIDLHEDLIIDSILNPNGSHLSFTRFENFTTIIQLQDTLTPHQSSSISIFYQGVPPEDGFGAFVQSSHDNAPIIWTLSEPYGALNWWPCGQNLVDKIDSLDLWITVPEGNRVAGNGLLVSETPIDGNKTLFHWKHRYPIATYLVAFAVTNYRVHEFTIPLENGPLPIINYLYPEDFDRHSKRIEESLPAMMQLFEELFIPYPFDREKYGHAQFGFGGGMEHQTMSFMVNFSFELTAHELAHQWFGDYVTCGSWQDVWLNEGFAGYLTGLAYEKILKNSTWERYLSSSIRDITKYPGGALMVSDTSTINRIFSSRLSYKKGAMVLHMLRWILGDNAFFEGLRQYLLDEETEYAFVRTHHLMDHLEQASGIDLKEFFSDWYEGQGYPSYHVQWQSNNTGIDLQVNQTTSHPSVPFFELPVEIGVYGTTHDTLVRLDIRENDISYHIELPWSVDSITIDPRNWLITAGNTTEVITSASSLPKNEKYKVYPNPSHGEITIENHGHESIRDVFLFTATGKLSTRYTKSINPESITHIKLPNHPPGFYYLLIQSQNGNSSSYKIILQ